MFRKLLTAAAGLAMIASTAAPLAAAPCKDTKTGRFIKCPPAAAGGVAKDAKGKCHVASGPKKGQFTKCP